MPKIYTWHPQILTFRSADSQSLSSVFKSCSLMSWILARATAMTLQMHVAGADAGGRGRASATRNQLAMLLTQPLAIASKNKCKESWREEEG